MRQMYLFFCRVDESYNHVQCVATDVFFVGLMNHLTIYDVWFFEEHPQRKFRANLSRYIESPRVSFRLNVTLYGTSS